MRTIDDLPTPALLLDIDILERNLRRMAERTRELGVSLRPHVKTHKCLEIALGQQALGASGIAVSTLFEARVFADRGFSDLTWAFPVIPSRIAEAAELAGRAHLGVVVDSAPALEALEKSGAPFHVWLKVDCGYHRAGVSPGDAAAIELARRAAEAETMQFAGLLSHSGHAYRASSPAAIGRIAEQERAVMAELAHDLRALGIEVPAVSVGSTPSMSRVPNLEGVTEVRPGNYALYDFTQVTLGACSVADCALTVLSTVVSARPNARKCVVDAGALALSLDPGPAHLGQRGFGEIFDDYAGGTLRQNARVESLSQEHGMVSDALTVGERIRILPNHSCLTVACFDAFTVVRGDEVIDTWKVWRGR